jgi:hypothetical protein
MTPTRAVTCGMARRICRNGWKRWAVIAGGLVAAATLCAACDGGNSPSTTSTGPPAATTTSTTPQEAAVLAAYRASQAAFQQAVHTANPTLPALTQTMTGGQLDSVRRALESDKLNGIVGKGTVVLHPRVASVSTTRAVVHDCLFSSSELIYAATGKPVPPVTSAEHDGVISTLSEISPGVWKVSEQHVTEGSCPAGY